MGEKGYLLAAEVIRNTVAVGTGLTGCVRIGLGWRCNVPNRDCRETACETGPLAKRVKVSGMRNENRLCGWCLISLAGAGYK